MPSARATRRLLVAIALGAAVLRVFPIWFGLPYPYARPDEAEAISRAMGVLRGDLNPHFFHWPSLTFYLFAAVLGGVSWARDMVGADVPLPRDVALLAARATVAVAGSLTVLAVYRIGKRLGGDVVALAAACFVAVATLHVRDSHFATADVLMTLLATMSLACLLAAFDKALSGTASLRDFALAGAAGGLAISTKYNAAAVLPAMAAVQVLLLARGRRALAPGDWAPSGVFGLACAAAFVAGTPYAVIDRAAFTEGFLYNLTHLSGGHGVDVGPAWHAHLFRSLPFGAGPVLFIAALAGSVLLARHRPGPAIVLAAFAGSYFAAVGSGRTAFFRYVLPLIPLVCLAAAFSVRGIAQYAARHSRLGASWAAILAIAALGGHTMVITVWMDVLLGRTDTRVLAANWLAPQLSPDATLHDAGGNYTRLDLRHIRYHEWHFDAAKQSFGHPLGLTPDWLVLPESPLRAYTSVDEGLRRLATSDAYELALTVPGVVRTPHHGVYDEQDAFFLPFSDLRAIARPGPTIQVYRRRR